MDGVDDQSPTMYMLIRINSRGIGIALALGRNLRGLGDNQPGRSPLAIVFGHQGVGHITGLGGPAAGHGRHHNAIRHREMAYFE